MRRSCAGTPLRGTAGPSRFKALPCLVKMKSEMLDSGIASASFLNLISIPDACVTSKCEVTVPCPCDLHALLQGTYFYPSPK